ncbi:L-seryl-tRNA selenium transferase [Cohnella sp. CFH 77786]|uniref:TVP38/TMEM64 family protein n=1 Tax=Cohnella sp. CFH 77786 TaxID=2662265 RepID=UPI001C60A571|nr:VTT domain-containing protein [Cohnella sp. CFH 77786]MBW5446242.1 L-seryl-tRNA selenium transferase [Cohnella sp. CFH 77786]
MDWFNVWVDRAVEVTGLTGTTILAVTFPLAVIQGFLGLFPFSTLILVHITALGVIDGLIASWAAGALSAIVVYLVCKFLFAERFRRKWGHRLERYEKWQTSFDRYGIWAIILLRTLPIMPNNLISFMSSVSPIRASSYVWSSVIGNLSHIWLFGIISSKLVFPGMDISLLIGTYAVFCLVLLAAFAAFRYRELRYGRHDKGDPTAL